MITPCAPSVSPRRIRQNGRTTLVRPRIGSAVGFRDGVNLASPHPWSVGLLLDRSSGLRSIAADNADYGQVNALGRDTGAKCYEEDEASC